MLVPPMPLTPRHKAITFAANLLLVSTILVGSAVASTNSALQPFLRGESFAKERSLTRGEFVSLAVAVGEASDGRLEPIEGALVRVQRPNGSEEVAQKQTGANGVAVFELKRGAYRLEVESEGRNATEHVALPRSLRIGVAFDADGEAHWQRVEHRELERRGDMKRLMVRVGESSGGGRPEPVEGAAIVVHRVLADGARERVAEANTSERGFANFALPRGEYIVELAHGDVRGEAPVRIRGDAVLGAVLSGDGVEWRSDRADAHDFERPRRGGPQRPR